MMKRLLFCVLLLAPFFAGAQTDNFKWIKQQVWTAAGTDTYTVTMPGMNSYVVGFEPKILFTNANTGSATLNINSIGAITLKKNGGTNLSAGDIPAGTTLRLSYDGTYFQVLGVGGGGGGSMVYPGAGIPLSTGSAWGTSITNNSANWNTAYGWGDHAGQYWKTSGNTTLPNGRVKIIVGSGANNKLTVGDSLRKAFILSDIPADPFVQLQADPDYFINVTPNALIFRTGPAAGTYSNFNSSSSNLGFYQTTSGVTRSLSVNGSSITAQGLLYLSAISGEAHLRFTSALASDPSAGNGYLWWRSTDNALRFRNGGTNYSLVQTTSGKTSGRFASWTTDDKLTQASFSLPSGLGISGDVLTTDGIGGTSWATPSVGGDVTKVGTPVDDQIGVWTGDGTIEGTPGLTYDGSNFQLTGDIGSTGTRITKGWFTDFQVTNAIAGSITGNAATVTTNANLTGHITSTGNATTLGSFTKAQLDGAVSDGNVLYVGDVTQYTDELAQDAVGAMVDASLTYVDGTPLLQRAALTGDVTASAGSNSTTIATGAVDIAMLSATGTPSASTYLRGDNTWATVSGSGDVVGPASAVDNTIAVFDGATGKLIGEAASATNRLSSAGDDLIFSKVSSVTGNNVIRSANGISGSTAAMGLYLLGGNGFASGNTDAGDVIIEAGVPNGSGAVGSIRIADAAQKIGFFDASPVVKQSAVTTDQGIADALTAYGLLPASTISGGGGGLTYAQVSALSVIGN